MNTSTLTTRARPHWMAVSIIAVGALWSSNSAQASGLMTPVGKTTSLAIRDHDVRVVVEDGYVITEVEQVFSNESGNDVEAVYSFPVPEHGAVAEFTYWIDGKPVTGEVVRRERAREIYEAEKNAGRETALAEKNDYRDFQISVYPVRGGKDVRTRLVYLQTAHTDTGIGRYVYPLEEGGVDEERDAFWDVRDAVTGRFSFTMDVKSSYPVDAVRVPGQPGAVTTQIGPGHWRVELGTLASAKTARPGAQDSRDFDAQIALIEKADASTAPLEQELINTLVAQAGALLPAAANAVMGEPESTGATRAAPVAARLDTDVVVYWRHQEGLPGSVDLVAWKPDASGFGTFMLTLTPGDDLSAITKGRDWVFILDGSGSMSGKYETLADGVEQALVQLRPEDRFRIIKFNNSATEITPGFVAAVPAETRRYADQVRRLGADGSTNLYAGLKKGIDALDSDRSSGLVLVTDGVANVGVTHKKKFVELLQQQDVRLYTMIMGNSANRPLLEEMAKVSNGFAMSVSNRDDIGGVLRLAVSKLTHAAMHDVEVNIEGVRAFDMQPAEIGSLYRGEQLVLLGHYKGGGDAQVSLKAEIAGTPVQYQTRFEFPKEGGVNPELERLWAYRTIESLQADLDYYGADADVEEGIADLAVEYGLVTNYTSMLIVRDEMFDALGIDRRNRDRVATERDQRQLRAQTAPINRRVDQQQPMFTSARPATGGSGGGAIAPVMLIGLLGAAGLRLSRRRKRKGD